MASMPLLLTTEKYPLETVDANIWGLRDLWTFTVKAKN